jgi:NADH-quinone oxidoreductase subunit C
MEKRCAGLGPPLHTPGSRLVTEQAKVENSPIVLKVRGWDPEAVAEVSAFRGELTLLLERERLRRTAEFLRDEPGLEFEFLSDISVLDRFPIEPRFELNYHLVSIANRQTLRLRIHLHGSSHPVIETITTVWPTANWHEREIFDLFGIRFEGHPDLRRILMPDDWEGYPLRRDYPVEGFR